MYFQVMVWLLCAGATVRTYVRTYVVDAMASYTGYGNLLNFLNVGLCMPGELFFFQSIWSFRERIMQAQADQGYGVATS